MMRSLNKSLLQTIWMIWEKGFAWISQFRSSHTLRFGICTVMVKRYRGESIICEDLTFIQDGDFIGELHLDNKTILTLTKTEGPDRAALKTARLVRKAIQQISEAFECRFEFREVKALVGITLLHRGLTHGLGFEQFPLKSGLFQRLTTSYLRLLLSVLHPEGNRRVARNKESLIPMMLVHSRSSLRNRFFKGSTLPGQLAGEDPCLLKAHLN